MDTTKKYIKMCEEAKEIHPKLQPFHMMESVEDLFYDDGDVWYAINVLGQIRKIWLPRQDQLQEMIPRDCDCGMIWLHQSAKLNNFTDWLCDYEEIKEIEAAKRNKEYDVIKTWEQLWLAFVMMEKYQKAWGSTEEQWIKQ